MAKIHKDLLNGKQEDIKKVIPTQNGWYINLDYAYPYLEEIRDINHYDLSKFKKTYILIGAIDD